MKGNFCHSSKFDSLSDMILKCSLVLPFLSIFAFANPFVRYAGHLIDAKHQFSNRRLLNNRASEDLNDDLSFVGSLPGDLFAVGNSRANHPGLSNIDYPESSPFDSQDTPIIPKLKDNSVDATNVALDQIDPQVSLTLTNSELVAECSPNNGYNRKRSISLDNQRACPNNAIPGRKPGPNIRNQPSDDQNQTPKSSSQTREPNDDPCGDRPSPAGGIPPMTELVSCGGPIVDTRLHPAYVFNCVPGHVESIEKRTFFDMVPLTDKFCCSYHQDYPFYYMASWCEALGEPGAPESIKIIWTLKFYFREFFNRIRLGSIEENDYLFHHGRPRPH